MTKILVTGATGFLGKALCLSLLKEGYEVRGTYRTSYPQDIEFQKVDWVKIPGLLPTEIWDKPLEGCDIIIHAAACVHQKHASMKEFYSDNVLGTKAIIESALKTTCIKQILFISTIGVYGKFQKMPVNQNEICLPDSLYGKSKLIAEQIIQSSLLNTTISWTILRPAVMYGNGNIGNIASLEKLIRKGIPIPVKGLKNKRSFLSIQNMCKFVKYSLLNDKAYNKTYCISNPTPISTEQLVLYLGIMLNQHVKVVRIPFFILYFLALICDLIQKLGISLPWNRDTLAKLSGDFWIDMNDTIKGLNISELLTEENKSSMKTKLILN